MQRQHQQEIADAAIASAKAASEAAEAQRQLQLEASTAASAAEIRQQQEAAVMLAHAVAAERAAGERTVAQVQRSSDKLHTQFPASCLRDPSNCRLHVANSLTAAAAGDGPTA
jgi:hypothetical protein